MKKRSEFNVFLTILLSVIFCAIGFLGGGYAYLYIKSKTEIDEITVYTSGEIQFHFLELGNKYTGDCTYIKVGDVDILIDAGSRVNSIPTITSYINGQMSDATLEYVIVTHAHQDHYAGFATDDGKDSIFDLYSVEVLIDFARTNQDDDAPMYNNYLRERQEAIARGTKHYTALDCVTNSNGASSVYELTSDTTLTILEHKYYTEEASSENDYSVCTLFSQGDNNFLLTGDLEADGEASLVSMNDLPHCDLYKAGHHGSKTSSSHTLLNEITPDICAVCCCAGNYEYTQENANNFPTQEFIDRISMHTKDVYVTSIATVEYDSEKGKYVSTGFSSMNGNIIVKSKNGRVEVECSNNTTKLKDTQWFKENRTTPEKWAG